MAFIDVQKMTKTEKTLSKSEPVKSSYVANNGMFQIVTYGKPDRKYPDAPSQLIEFDFDGLKALVSILQEEFPMLFSVSKIKVSLLANNGEPQYGLNWGQRDGRNPNQAYIQLTPEIYRSDFFPKKPEHFKVQTDDNQTLVFTRAQKTEEGTALQTPEDNSIFGIYLRNRMNIPLGNRITKEDILKYGCTDITFFKIGDSYFMDFSTNLESNANTFKFNVSTPKSSFSLAPFIQSTHANTSFATRYVASLLAKPFVILTGNSGTGKTRIARQLAKWLEKSSANEKNWLLVPVGADWTDNTKILGYYNPLANGGAGEYVESEILRLIERANANPALPFFLILDEMNLSHVERYFSDFLSKMETPGDPFEIDHYGTLRFPENLFITGTVNIDETTYMFSPKVLDRANVIEFKPTVDELFGDAAGSSSGEVVTAEDGMAEAFMHLASKVRKDNSPLGQELTDSLKEIYGILDGYGFEFAFRTVNEIRLYMAAARELGTEETALDEQVLQKILPKIHGNRKQIGEMLDRLEEKCGSLKLAASAEKIVWMKSRLERFQYASFV